jgi:mercuric ion binding protein
MKRNIIFTTTLFFLFSVLSLSAQEKKGKELSTVRFETSIDCENCVNTIMKNIPFEKGVRDVKCDLTTKEVLIQYQKEKTNPETLKRSIEKLGYTAKVIKENEEKKPSANSK